MRNLLWESSSYGNLVKFTFVYLSFILCPAHALISETPATPQPHEVEHLVDIIPSHSTTISVYCYSDKMYDVSFHPDKKCDWNCRYSHKLDPCCKIFEITEDTVIKCYRSSFKTKFVKEQIIKFTATVIRIHQNIQVVSDPEKSVLSCLQDTKNIQTSVEATADFYFQYAYLYDGVGKEFGTFKTLERFPLSANGETVSCNETKYRFEHVHNDTAILSVIESLNSLNARVIRMEGYLKSHHKFVMVVIILLLVILLPVSLIVCYRWEKQRKQSQNQKYPDPEVAPVQSESLALKVCYAPKNLVKKLFTSKSMISTDSGLEVGESSSAQQNSDRNDEIISVDSDRSDIDIRRDFDSNRNLPGSSVRHRTPNLGSATSSSDSSSTASDHYTTLPVSKKLLKVNFTRTEQCSKSGSDSDATIDE